MSFSEGQQPTNAFEELQLFNRMNEFMKKAETISAKWKSEGTELAGSLIVNRDITRSISLIQAEQT